MIFERTRNRIRLRRSSPRSLPADAPCGELVLVTPIGHHLPCLVECDLRVDHRGMHSGALPPHVGGTASWSDHVRPKEARS